MAAQNGCNCGKPKPGPYQGPQPAGGSGGLAGQTQSFTLQFNNGTTQRFTGSQLEANAALVRAGGGSIIPR